MPVLWSHTVSIARSSIVSQRRPAQRWTPCLSSSLAHSGPPGRTQTRSCQSDAHPYEAAHRASGLLSEQRNLLAPDLFIGVPHGKIKQFAAEAKTLDVARMREMLPRKRYTLAAALLLVQSAQALDDLAEMLIKRMLAIHQKGKKTLHQYHLEHQARTDALVTTLRDLVVAYRKEGTAEERFTAIEGVLASRARKCSSSVRSISPMPTTPTSSFSASCSGATVRCSFVCFCRHLPLHDAGYLDGSRTAFLRAAEASHGDWLRHRRRGIRGSA